MLRTESFAAVYIIHVVARSRFFFREEWYVVPSRADRPQVKYFIADSLNSIYAPGYLHVSVSLSESVQERVPWHDS